MSDERKITAHSLKCKESVWERFKDVKDGMDDVTTDGQALERLIDVYEEPPKPKILDKEIAKQNEEYCKKIEELRNLIEQQNQELANLRQQLDDAVNTGNANGENAQRIQLELEASQERIRELEEAAVHQETVKANRPENIFEVEVHPVPYYFLKKMSEFLTQKKKEEVTPGYILVDLFVKSLQNPRSNHLPYVVSTSEIEKVLNEYKKAHPEEYENN